MRPQISALHSYDWDRQVAAPGLVAPVFSSPTMTQARQAAFEDGSFLTFFLGIEANVDFIIGGAGGVGVGLPFPSLGPSPLWMAYGGLRIALNIDASINLGARLLDRGRPRTGRPSDHRRHRVGEHRHQRGDGGPRHRDLTPAPHRSTAASDQGCWKSGVSQIFSRMYCFTLAMYC
jgi:hypothetical protein